jgi:hypothetical protein
MVRLTIGPDKTMFTIHADLLCANAPFFREKFQSRRRPIEDDCSICQEMVRLGDKELTYCNSCGVNFHYRCIEQWKARTADGEPTTCPMCRQEWIQHRLKLSHTFVDMIETAFEIYSEWLYKGHITTWDDLEDDTESWSIWSYIYAYQFGLKIEDWKFCDATLHSMVEDFVDDNTYPDKEVIALVYESTPGPCRLRRFLVGVFIHLDLDAWNEVDPDTELPPAFLLDVMLALRRKHPADEDLWNVDTLKARLCIAGGHTDVEG